MELYRQSIVINDKNVSVHGPSVAGIDGIQAAAGVVDNPDGIINFDEAVVSGALDIDVSAQERVVGMVVRVFNPVEIS